MNCREKLATVSPLNELAHSCQWKIPLQIPHTAQSYRDPRHHHLLLGYQLRTTAESYTVLTTTAKQFNFSPFFKSWQQKSSLATTISKINLINWINNTKSCLVLNISALTYDFNQMLQHFNTKVKKYNKFSWLHCTGAQSQTAPHHKICCN